MCRFTINEPLLVCQSGYGFGNMAPGLHLEGDGIYQCGYVLLKAHARAYRIYDEEFRPKYDGKRFWIFEKNIYVIVKKLLFQDKLDWS